MGKFSGIVNRVCMFLVQRPATPCCAAAIQWASFR
jgi:hypothetical protein